MVEPKKSKERVAGPSSWMGERAMAGTIIGTHTMTHVYARGFLVIVPLIFQQMGLTYVQAGFMDTVRWLTSGLTSIIVGFYVDMFQHRRGLFLGLSMAMMGVGYYLVGLAPSYGLILAALIFAHIGSALWHPPALGLLSQRFPSRRGLVIALHRSTGSLGDFGGPLMVGFFLAYFTWRGVLQNMLPIGIALGILLWVFLWKVGGPKSGPVMVGEKFQAQMSSLGKAVRIPGLITLLAVSALRGMGDRALFLFIPLFLATELEMKASGVGVYTALLALPAIASGPILGAVSDRVGRKPLIVMALLVSCVFPIIIITSYSLQPWFSISGVDFGLMALAIILFGMFLYSVNSLVQAAVMDMAEGMKLEGTFIGMLWGNNALFGAFSPVIAGLLADRWGTAIPFYYASAIFLTAGILAIRLPLSGQNGNNTAAT